MADLSFLVDDFALYSFSGHKFYIEKYVFLYNESIKGILPSTPCLNVYK